MDKKSDDYPGTNNRQNNHEPTTASTPTANGCSFCGRGKDEIKRLFTANGKAICPECVASFHKDLE